MRKKLVALNLALVLAVSLLCPTAYAMGVTVESDKEIHIEEAGFYCFYSHSVASCYNLSVYPVDDSVKLTKYASGCHDPDQTYWNALYYIPADTTVKMSANVKEGTVSFQSPQKVTFTQTDIGKTFYFVEGGYKGMTVTPETSGWYSGRRNPSVAFLGNGVVGEEVPVSRENWREYDYYLMAGETYSLIYINYGYLEEGYVALKWSTRNDPVEGGDDFSMGASGYDSTTLERYNGPGGKVVIPDGVTEIGAHAFTGRTDVTEVVVPDSVQRIGYDAFYHCAGLKSVTLPCPEGERAKLSISGGAFAHCDSLTDVYFAGSQAQWDERVTIYGGDPALENATYHYARTDGTLESNDGVQVTWSLDRASGTVSVPADAIPAEHRVMVAEFDEQGSFIGLRILTAQRLSAVVSQDASQLKFIWLDGALTPQCPAAPVDA